MRLWRRNKRESKELHPVIIRLLANANSRLLKWADYLQHKTLGYSIGKMKFYLFLLCATFISASTIIIVRSLQDKHQVLSPVTPIKTVTLLKEEQIQSTINRNELSRIHRFKLYLDSLAKTASGKLIRDSLLSKRPYLLDTLNFLENIYKEQAK